MPGLQVSRTRDAPMAALLPPSALVWPPVSCDPGVSGPSGQHLDAQEAGGLPAPAFRHGTARGHRPGGTLQAGGQCWEGR